VLLSTKVFSANATENRDRKPDEKKELLADLGPVLVKLNRVKEKFNG